MLILEKKNGKKTYSDRKHGRNLPTVVFFIFVCVEHIVDL